MDQIARQDGRFHCRSCAAELRHTFVDLGMSPLCESYVAADQLQQMEPFYPLHVFVCDQCFLVQLLEYVSAQSIYSHYAYFSSYSDSWLEHARQFAEMVTRRFDLGTRSRVIEIASNDGYLMQFFAARGIPVLGIEPAANIAAVAQKKGLTTIVKFIGADTARQVASEHGPADLLIGNNVLAHVPDLNDFVSGLKVLLGARGVITMEFPHVVRLIEQNQFDTIYHEHFQYLSLFTVEKIFARHGLTVFDVEELQTHGGSLRIYARHTEDTVKPIEAHVAQLREAELRFGVTELAMYRRFDEKVQRSKHDLLEFLIKQKRLGKRIAGYGAPGKGNTLLNYCSIRQDFIDYTVDRNPFKQGKFLPGTRIPIHGPEKIRQTRPDLVLILPWNIKNEIVAQLAYIRDWGGRFVVPIPKVEVLP